MAEFSAIDKHLNYFSKDASVIIGIGDDAAVIDCPDDHFLVQTLDIMVAGVHFDASYSAAEIAHKLIHVNLSDIAAMGAIPKWATIGLTIPSLDDQWLADFSKSLHQQADIYGVNLIGGDTTQGALTLSMNLTGLIKKSDGLLTRSGAKLDDDIYVSGSLGEASLALDKPYSDNSIFQQRLRKPQARVELGPELLVYATACLDVSDGLLQDLGHICKASQLMAVIDVERIPLSTAYQKATQSPDFALNGGDDYELCFTASVENRDAIEALSKRLKLPLRRIGKMTLNETSKCTDENTDIAAVNIPEPNKSKLNTAKSNNHSVQCLLNGAEYICQRVGWQHFE